jgi:predicted double-glycine peptidase
MTRTFLLAGVLASSLAAHAQGMYFPDLGGTAARLPVTGMKQARAASTVLQQYDFSCGSAALATLLTHHYGRPVQEQQILQAMYAVGDKDKIHREGFSLLDMKLYLEGLGYTANGFRQPLEKLASAGLPAIVLINEHGYRHFVVIKGLQGDRILLGDPARGTRAMALKEFRSAWIGELLFVIHNHTSEARFNLPSDWQAAPRAPMSAGRAMEGSAAALPKFGPGDF